LAAKGDRQALAIGDLAQWASMAARIGSMCDSSRTAKGALVVEPSRQWFLHDPERTESKRRTLA